MAASGGPGVTMSLRIEGMPTVQRLFRKAYEQGQDRKPLLKRVGQYFLATVTSHKPQVAGNIKTAFEAHGRFTPWPALTMATYVKKLNQGKSPMDYLVDTGELRKSFSYDLIGNTGVEIGTAVPYAAPLQEGWKYRGPSPMLEVGPPDEAEIEQYCREWLEKLGFM